MPTTIENHIDDGLRTHLLYMYREAFEPLRTLTATKQTLTDEEFRALLDYDAATLFLNRDSVGSITGFAITVTDLKLIPWINPEFFGRVYPEQYATGRVVYVPFFVIDPAHQKGTTFMSITRELAQLLRSPRCGTHNGLLPTQCRRRALPVDTRYGLEPLHQHRDSPARCPVVLGFRAGSERSDRGRSRRHRRGRDCPRGNDLLR